MKWWTVGTLALAASCASTTAQHRQVRESFEAWRDAAAAGDVEKVLRGMTPAFRSEWVFRLLTAGDPEAQEWRIRLAGTPARTDLDLWLEHQKKYAQGRPEVLPATVLSHPTLEPLLLGYLNREREALKHEFSGLTVTEVYLDETGATVTVQNRLKQPEMYELVPAPGGWMINGHRRPLRPLPR